MRWCHSLLICAAVLAFAAPAPAGILSKRQKPNPAQRVPELIQTLRQERDERKRAAAAEELRQYDPNQFPEIVPALIQSLQTDPQWGVRYDAAQSLGKLRPVSQPAGRALEKAASEDGSLRVRLQARTSLMFYHLAGYSSRKDKDTPPQPGTPGAPKTEEPPLAAPTPPPPALPAQTAPPPLAFPAETAPPPLAPTAPPPAPPQAAPAPAPTPAPDVPRPMPSGPPPGEGLILGTPP